MIKYRQITIRYDVYLDFQRNISTMTYKELVTGNNQGLGNRGG